MLGALSIDEPYAGREEGERRRQNAFLRELFQILTEMSRSRSSIVLADRRPFDNDALLLMHIFRTDYFVHIMFSLQFKALLRTESYI